MHRFKYVTNLVAFALRENPLLWAGIGLSLCSVALELLAMSSLMPLFELISGGPPSSHGLIPRLLLALGFQVEPGTLLWAFIILFAIRILTQLVAQMQSTYFSKLVMAQLGSRSFEQILRRIAIREISQKSIGFYVGLAGDEAFRASTLVMSLTQLLSTAALALFYYVAILAYSVVTGALVVAFLLCTSVPFLLAMRASHRLGGRQTEQSRRAHSIFLDALNNLKTVRSFSAEQYASDLYRGTIFAYVRTLFLSDAIALLIKLLPVLLLLAVFATWLFFSHHALQHVGVAFIVTMIVYLMRFFPVLGQCGMLAMKVANDAKAGKDVTALVHPIGEPAPVPARATGSILDIEFDAVGFSYDERAATPVLSDIRLRLQRGKSYALVGKSGIGKSTLIDLLLKFHPPTSGELRVNSVPMSEVTDTEIRTRIILVGQEPAIFDDTVTHNVCLGRPADPSEVEVACRKARIHPVIEAMPQGYGTRLQYQGKNLSGGQRQRIAIARALLRDPDVLVLDEATSALDKETQSEVIEGVLREYSDRIVILVTHDPHLVGLVDEVIDLSALNLAAAGARGPVILQA
jgi:ABC-type multidrug transport system fused ATPase/permease subunit